MPDPVIPGGEPNASASGGGGDNPNPDQNPSNPGGKGSVSYDSHQKLLNEKKALQAQRDADKAELERLRNKTLESEGKKDELIQSLKSKVSEVEAENKKMVGSFALQSITSALKAEAAKHGCIDPDAMISLAKPQNIDVDDNFIPNAEQVKNVIEDMRKTKPYLFGKSAPAVHTVTPSGSAPNGQAPAEDLSKLSIPQLMERLKTVN